MSRKLLRVPLSFSWPLNKIWGGYPTPEVLAFWETGFGGGGDARAYCTVVALVRCPSEGAATAVIEGAWSPGVGAWRFNRAYDGSAAPSDRFPAPHWAIQMDRWPWTRTKP